MGGAISGCFSDGGLCSDGSRWHFGRRWRARLGPSIGAKIYVADLLRDLNRSDLDQPERCPGNRCDIPGSNLLVYCLYVSCYCDRGGENPCSRGPSSSGDRSPEAEDRHGGHERMALIRAFSSGCAAMTGVEAVSN